MTVEEDVLGRIIRLLDRLAIPYMVTGSIAASYFGRPRSTHDADVVIDPAAHQADGLLTGLSDEGFYVNAESAARAIGERRPFNAIETATATKVDLIVRKTRAFSVVEFGRQRRVDLAFAPQVSMVSPEDAILSKLEWARIGGDSERQIRDAAGIVEVMTGVDRAYIRRWARDLGVLDLWERIAPVQ